jgi:hypothetical protein
MLNYYVRETRKFKWNFTKWLRSFKSRDSSVGIALGYGLDSQGSRVWCPAGAGKKFFSTVSRTALGPIQPRIQWVPGTFSLGVKRPGREADHSPSSRAEVKEWVQLYLHSPNKPSWCGAQVNHRDSFTFTFTYTLSVDLKIDFPAPWYWSCVWKTFAWPSWVIRLHFLRPLIHHNGHPDCQSTEQNLQ